MTLGLRAVYFSPGPTPVSEWLNMLLSEPLNEK